MGMRFNAANHSFPPLLLPLLLLLSALLLPLLPLLRNAGAITVFITVAAAAIPAAILAAAPASPLPLAPLLASLAASLQCQSHGKQLALLFLLLLLPLALQPVWEVGP